MSKPKRKPSVPMMPIEWIDTPTQNMGCAVEVLEEQGKARRKRRYRYHVLEQMAKRRAGRMKINERQKLAGLAIHAAWCRTMHSPPAVREIVVDATPRPDDITVAQVVAMQAYADMIEVIPSAMRPVVRHVACEGRSLRDGFAKDGHDALGKCAELQVALDILANDLGY